MGGGVVWLVGDVVSFVIQMRIPLPSRQLLHHAGSRVTRLGWAGWAGLAGLGWDTNYGDGVGDTSLQTHQAHGHMGTGHYCASSF